MFNQIYYNVPSACRNNHSNRIHLTLTRSGLCLLVILKMKHIPNVHYNNILCDPKVKMTCSFTETITLMLNGKIFFTPTFFTFQFIF